MHLSIRTIYSNNLFEHSIRTTHSIRTLRKTIFISDLTLMMLVTSGVISKETVTLKNLVSSGEKRALAIELSQNVRGVNSVNAKALTF